MGNKWLCCLDRPNCGINCNFCYPNEWRDKLRFRCEYCIKVSELPSGLDNVQVLMCWGCVNLTNIPSLSSLSYLYCYGCPLLSYIPELPNISEMDFDNCILLTEWKQRGENVRDIYFSNCPLLHLYSSLFIRFNGLELIFEGNASGDPRPRNGVSSRFLSSFSFCKKLYCFELPSRVALEVSLNAILYAPGGAKYLDIADRYKDGIQVCKSKKL